MKEFITIGLFIPTIDESFVNFSDNHSLSDADIVIMSLSLEDLNLNYHSDGNYQGKPNINLNYSAKLKQYTEHWKKELKAYLKSGKTLFISLSQKEELYVDTGQRTTSGTGRNQKVTNIVETFYNTNFLPFELDIHNAKGKKMSIIDPVLKGFYSIFSNNLEYEAYLNKSDNLRPLITTKSGDKILSAALEIDEGKVIILPKIPELDDDYYDVEGAWSNKALTYGKRFIHSILEIEKSISSVETKTPKPEWVNGAKYNLLEAEKTKNLINKEELEIDKLLAKVKDLKLVVDEQELLHNLLYETGKPLENAVIKALKILDYEAENFDDGVLELDQVINSPEGIRFIGECEGKDNKAIDISKLRQLMDSLNEDFAREDIEDKAFGLLFGNPQRLLPVNERKELFTTKSLKGAEREKIGLILTSDLFLLTKYLTENIDPKFKKTCREVIYNGLGGLIKFPNIPKK